MANRHMKRCSVTTHHHGNENQNHNEVSPQTGRVATTIKNTNNNCWQGCEVKGIILCYQWECKLVQPLWKTAWEFLKKLTWEYHMIQQFYFWVISGKNEKPKH